MVGGPGHYRHTPYERIVIRRLLVTSAALTEVCAQPSAILVFKSV